MITRLAFRLTRKRITAFTGTLVAALLAMSLITGSLLLIMSAIGGSNASHRFDAVDLAISPAHEIKKTTVSGDKEKVKTKQEVLTGLPVLPADLTTRLASQPGVASVIGDVVFAARLSTGHVLQLEHNEPLFGHNLSAAGLSGFAIAEGKQPGSNEIALSTDAAKQLGLTIGDKLTLHTKTADHQVRLAALMTLPEGRVLQGQQVLFVPDAAITTYAGTTSPSILGVKKAAGVSTSELKQSLANVMPKQSGIQIYGSGDISKAEVPAAQVSYVPAISLFAIMGAVTIFEAVFVLAITINLAASLRIRELSLLRTIGATPRQLRQLVARQTFFVAIPAAIASIPLSWVMTQGILQYLQSINAVPNTLVIQFSPVPVIVGIVIGLVITQIAAAIVGKSIASIPPNRAMAEAWTGTSRLKKSRLITGIICLAGAFAVMVFGPLDSITMGIAMSIIAAALLISAAGIFGPFLARIVGGLLGKVLAAVDVTGALAHKNLKSQRKRMASIAIPLALIIAINAMLVTNLGIAAEYAREQTRARFASASHILVPDRYPGFASAAVAAIQRIEGSSVALLPTTVIVIENGKPQHYPAQGVELEGRQAPLDMGIVSGRMALGAGDVMVSDLFAQQRGWAIGEALTVWLPDGTSHRLAVSGTYKRVAGFGEFAVPLALARAHDPQGRVQQIAVQTKSGAGALYALPDVRSVSVREASPASRGGTAEHTQAGAGALLIAISLSFTTVAVFTVFVLSTNSRKQELLTLQLAGALPSQVRRMVLYEAIIATGVGLLVGGGIATLVSSAYGIAQTGMWQMTAGLPFVLICMLSLIIGLTAGIVSLTGNDLSTSRTRSGR
jgi:putative ABC transport system permease protein